MNLLNTSNYQHSFYENGPYEAGVAISYATPDDEVDLFNVYTKVKESHEECESREFYSLKAALDFANEKYRHWSFGNRVQIFQQEKLKDTAGACSSCDNKH